MPEKANDLNALHNVLQCNVLTIFVARLVDQTRLICQQCIDLYYFSRQWRIQLTGGLHALQGAKLICQKVKVGNASYISEDI